MFINAIVYKTQIFSRAIPQSREKKCSPFTSVLWSEAWKHWIKIHTFLAL